MSNQLKAAASSRLVAVIAFIGTVATWASSRLAEGNPPLTVADWAHVVAMGCSAFVGSVLGSRASSDQGES